METTTFNMIINPAKKARLESVYGKLGFSLPEAVDTIFEQSLLVNGFPFTIQQPEYSEETEAAMHEAREKRQKGIIPPANCLMNWMPKNVDTSSDRAVQEGL